jgi:hypothetical protein
MLINEGLGRILKKVAIICFTPVTQNSPGEAEERLSMAESG